MKWKSGWMIMVMAGLILCSSGCGRQPIEDTTENSSISEEEAELVDEQYLLEHCGVTKEELEGIDVEDFINEWQLTEQYVQEWDVHTSIRLYREWLADEEYEKTYGIYADIIAGAATGGYQDEYEEQVTVLILATEYGNWPETMVYDLEKGAFYYGDRNDVIADYSQATKTGEIREEDIQTCRELIEEAEISGWQAVTGELDPDTTDSTTWSLTIQCSDGNSYYYWGYEQPQGLFNLYLGVLKLMGEEPYWERD